MLFLFKIQNKPYLHHNNVSFLFLHFYILFFSSSLFQTLTQDSPSDPQDLSKNRFVVMNTSYISTTQFLFFEISCFGLSLCANGAITQLSRLKKCPSQFD